MTSPLERFKSHVIDAAHRPTFSHHEWFVEHHLRIVERIVKELCGFYPEANEDLVNALVWLHDYGKIVDRANEEETTRKEGVRQLLVAGFSQAFAEKAITVYEEMENHAILSTASLEAKIISSADGAAHLVGPFYALWWKENAHKPVHQLMVDNALKATFDWEKKIVLPEVRQAFAGRHRLRLELCGELPHRFLDL